MSTAKFDLTTAEGVKGYLEGTEFASCGPITELSGGTANHAYRVALDKPYMGKNTVVIKHARPYVKDMTTLPFDVSRQKFEVEALKRVKPIVPDGSIVTVPEVYVFDEKEHVIVMEDCGAESIPLKQFMREGRLSPSMGAKLGKGIGEFIGRLHVWGKDKAVWEYFDANAQAKRLSAWATYGLIEETLDPSQNGKIAVLQDPPLEVSAQDLEVAKKVAEEMGNAVRNGHETFVMGDFWPGNMIITPDLERVLIVDWELCKPGLPGVEIGQFCAEIGFVRHFHPGYATAANEVLRSFFGAYEEITKPEESVLKMAAVRAGTHFVVVGSRVEWGAKEKTREVVRRGVRLIVEGQISEFR